MQQHSCTWEDNTEACLMSLVYRCPFHCCPSALLWALCCQAQQDRDGVLEAAAEAGVVRSITAWRRTLKGNRVQIRDAVLFNLETPTGNKVRAFGE